MHLVIHPGLPKCGSTAFQDWCHSSEDTLSIYGVYYPGGIPENGDFIAEYLEYPSPQKLRNTLSQINSFAAEAQARGLNTLLLSSEQIFQFSGSLGSLQGSITENLQIIRRLSNLVISRDVLQLAPSSWRQSILAEGERLDLHEYTKKLEHIFTNKINEFGDIGNARLIKYPYTKPLDFRKIIELISFEDDQSMPSNTSLDQDACPSPLLKHTLSNETLPAYCYNFWLSCNRAYNVRAHCISTIRFQLLQERPALRKFLFSNNLCLRSNRILSTLENTALDKFFKSSPVQRARGIISRFFSDVSCEKQQAVMEFLIINDDYLYEPCFSWDHREVITLLMNNASERSRSFDEILKSQQ
jgi:hypothetical protein